MAGNKGAPLASVAVHCAGGVVAAETGPDTWATVELQVVKVWLVTSQWEVRRFDRLLEARRDTSG